MPETTNLLAFAPASFGITALLRAVPFAYDTLRLAGALYLPRLAWQEGRPGARRSSGGFCRQMGRAGCSR